MLKVVKTPMIMQMEALECGAACLCMILAYHGKWKPLEQVRSDCGVSRDGSNAKNLIRAARAYGLSAKGYRMEPSSLRDITFPAIIHWEFNHFVVLNGFKRDRAVINDPARGVLEISADEFDKAFTGVVLCFEKTESFVPEGKPRSVIAFAKKRLEGTRPAFVFVILSGTVMALVGLAIPLFSRMFTDYILSGKNPEWLHSLIFAMLLTLGLQLVIGVIESIYWMKIKAKLSVKANASFMWHVLHLPTEFFYQRFAADIALRQSSNEAIAAVMINKLAPILVNTGLLVLYLAIMINYSWILSLIGITAVVVNVFLLRLISKKRMNMSRMIQRDEGRFAGVTVSGFEMIETIKASGSENGFFQRWADCFTRLTNAQTAQGTASRIYGMIPFFLQKTAEICVLMVGVYLIMEGRFTIGMLIAFQGFLSSFLMPVNELVDAGQSLDEMRFSIERIEDVFNYKTDVSYDNSYDISRLERLTGDIEIRNLTFGYNRLSDPLIDNFSLKVCKGGSVALVGGSGSGKSTIAKLISGLYSPWSGEILFDKVRREEIDRKVFTDSLSVVDQEIVLFEDTVMNNITMWDRSIPEEDVVTACKIAQIHEEIMGREGGYKHVVKEGGSNFSGGQRQRLEIARALATDPTVLILDEATSALDTKTEQKLMEAVKSRGITLIIIAHRLSTIRDCDEIIVLEKGKAVEQGTHAELVKLDGIYAKLIEN